MLPEKAKIAHAQVPGSPFQDKNFMWCANPRLPTQEGALAAGAADVEAAAHITNKRNQTAGLLASQAGQPSNAGVRAQAAAQSIQHYLRAVQFLTLMAPHHDAAYGDNVDAIKLWLGHSQRKLGQEDVCQMPGTPGQVELHSRPRACVRLRQRFGSMEARPWPARPNTQCLWWLDGGFVSTATSWVSEPNTAQSKPSARGFYIWDHVYGPSCWLLTPVATMRGSELAQLTT